MVSAIKDPLTFDDLMVTPINFSKYVLNRLKIDNLTQDILLGPAYNLLKGTCSSSIELEYHFQECFNALTARLDLNNPKGDRYPFDLSKPYPLQGHLGHLTVAADYFFNNDLEYLKSSDLERMYTTSITKTKAARYEIEGVTPHSSEDSVGSHVPQVILFGAIPAIILVIPVIPVEADSESEPAEQRPKRYESLVVHDAMVSRWRDRVASMPSSLLGSSSYDTLASLSKFPIAPVVSSPGIRRRPVILIRPVGPFPARRLAWRHVSHRLSDRHSSPDFTSDSSSFGSSSDSSLDTSSGSPSDSLLDTSSVHSSSEVFRRWRFVPLSTPDLPTTSDSSLDSSSERSLDSSLLFAGPSYKRCISPTTSVPSSTPISRSIAPTLVDLLPPRKRFRGSYSLEDSKEEHIETSTADVEAIADLSIGDKVRAHTEDGIGMGVEIAASDIREDEEEFETAQRQLEASQLMAGLTDRIRRLGRENLRDMTITRSGMTPEAIEELITQRVAEALANYEETRAANALEAESQSQNGNDGDNGNGGNVKWCSYVYLSRLREVSTTQLQRMVPEEEDQIERYVRGLPDNIQGNVMSVEPTRLKDAIRLANSLMDQKLKGYAIRSAENKSKFKSNQRDNCAQQPQFKRQNVGGSNVARAYIASGMKIGYLNRDCKPVVPAAVNHRALVVNQRSATCFECGRQGHFKKDFPKLKNQNHGNKPVIPEARGKAYAIGGGDANQESNFVTEVVP
ncbi:reverse transcriptase domain-containing protein [Tanacetum coccineum]